jgi:hypothetical protein
VVFESPETHPAFFRSKPIMSKSTTEMANDQLLSVNDLIAKDWAEQLGNYVTANEDEEAKRSLVLAWFNGTIEENHKLAKVTVADVVEDE